jgi:putative oxidoreductase
MLSLDLGLLVLRVAVGSIYVAHGLRKLGVQNPDGFAGFRGAIVRRGYRPALAWALVAVVAEVGGGVLAIVGLLTPVAAAALVAQSVTIVALVRGRGFWVESMGVEYPLMLGVAAVVVGLAGPGSLSLDAVLGIEPPWWTFPVLAAVGVAGALVGLATRRPQAEPSAAPIPAPAGDNQPG